MKYINNGKDLTVYLEGRIDTNNAAETEKAIIAALEEYPESVPEFDLSSLEYISSAGLRALMKLRKAEPLGVLHHHDRRIRHIHTDLDDRRCDEKLRFALVKRTHGLFHILRLQLSVH